MCKAQACIRIYRDGLRRSVLASAPSSCTAEIPPSNPLTPDANLSSGAFSWPRRQRMFGRVGSGCIDQGGGERAGVWQVRECERARGDETRTPKATVRA
eukprot:6209225-Pleurochrysis_carterae.AAC.2